MTTGVCRNQACPNGQAAVRVERYPGPGEYCPECGSLLDDASPQPTPRRAPPPEPSPLREAPPEPAPRRPTALEELQRLESLQTAAAPARPGPARSQRRSVIAGIGVLAAAVLAVGVIRAMAVGGPGGAIHVCGSSMTERFAADVVRAYAAASRTPAARFAPSTTDCDVRFAATRTTSTNGLVGHDGIVAVVNPQNPLGQLTEQQLRMIFTGEITDWSQIGGAPGHIVPILTSDTSDEAQAIMAGLLRGRELANTVRRVKTSPDVVHTVTSGNGRNSIGLAAFSAAVPAKVLKLAALPAPSVLSIGEHRYPLTVTVSVAAEHPSHGSPPTALAEFAQSDAAQAIAMRDGIIPRKGF